MNRLSIDLDQATMQLEALGYTDDDYIFLRKIPPKGGKGTPKKSRYQFRDLPKTQLDDGGIYFVVNGGGHVDKAVGQGRALFCEWDDRPIDEQITLWQKFSFPAPSFQVKTRKSVHCYWVLDEPMAIDDWKEMQAQFLEYMDADRTIKNPSRVMRLAGGWHIAEGMDPIQCELINFTGEKFVADDLRGLIKFVQPVQTSTPPLPTVPTKVKPQKLSSGDRVPLDYFLTKGDRQLLEQGAEQGQRNQSAFRIACNLRAREQALGRLGIPYSGMAVSLFLDFCERCASSPDWNQKEWSAIWDSSEGKYKEPDGAKLQEIYDYWTKPKTEKVKTEVKTTTAIENQRYKQKLETAQEILKKNDPQGYAEIIAKTTTAIAPVTTYIDSENPDEGIAIDDDEPERPPAFTFQEIALQYLYGRGHYLAIDEKTLYKFNGKFYEKLSTAKEKKRIHEWASSFVVKEKGRRTFAHMKPASINSIWEWVLSRFNEDMEDLNPEGFNFDNGILRIHWEGNTPTWKLHPHQPKEKYLACSPVRYDPNANPEMCDRLLAALDPISRSVLLRNLSGIFDMDKIREIHGRIFRAGFAVGNGANGKDTFRDMVSLLFPRVVVSVALSKFVEYDQGNAKALKKLEHCRINWSSENNQETPLDKIQSLNILVTGEKNVFEIEEKYIASETMAEPPKAIYIFNCNNPPIIKSGLKSLQSRIVVYKFNKTFDENPDISRGELKADPRFKYDQQFQIEQLAPAFLNRMLEEFKNLALEGIDYRPLESGMLDLQEKSTHLWSFVRDEGIKEDPEGKIYVYQLWEILRNWYIESGTLVTIKREDGRTFDTWNDQPTRFDKNIMGANQVFTRLQKLFPNIEKHRETKDPWNKGRFFIKGLTIKKEKDLLNTASPASLPDSISLPASPTDSPTDSLNQSSSLINNPSIPLDSLYISSLEGVSEDVSEGASEAVALAMPSGEAVKQISKSEFSTGKKPNDSFIYSIGDRLWDSKTNQPVFVIGYPNVGVYFSDRSYPCRFGNGNEDWIKQNHLKPF